MQSESTNSVTGLISGFDNFDSRLKTERQKRIEAGKNRMSFGVPFLDEALGGIYQNDLVLLGAKSGVGKTQLSTLIAFSNALAGKRVHYLALEAEPNEIERRIKYQKIAELFYAEKCRPIAHKLNYMDWYYGDCEPWVDQYEKEAEELIKFPKLSVFYRSGDFTEKDFERIYLSIKDETDLVIVDHLHYFDHTDDNENRAIKSIVKKISTLALNVGKPVVLVSHIRKTDKRLKQVLPDLEDFHGSSDIGKIATKAIVLAPKFDATCPKNTRQTYLGIVKCRVDGSRNRQVGLVNFNLSNQRYDQGYMLGRLNADQSDFIATNLSDLPDWSKSSKNWTIGCNPSTLPFIPD